MQDTRVRGDQYQGLLAVGQRVYCGLYGGKFGIIRRIHGEQSPQSVRSIGGIMQTGGRAEFDVIFEDHESRMLPECIIRGVQWEITNEIVDACGIAAAVERLERFTEQKEKEKQEAARQFAEEVSALPGQYPYLQAKDGKKSDHALAAANIRKQLKREFPSVKFSVTSESYSGGDSVDVRWEDGPTNAAVRSIADQYSNGNFDGMTDSYNYHRSPWTELFGGTKYVSCSRSESVDFMIRAAASEGYKLTTDDFYPYGGLKNQDHWIGEAIRNYSE